MGRGLNHKLKTSFLWEFLIRPKRRSFCTDPDMRNRMKLNICTYLQHACVSILTLKTHIDHKSTFIHHALQTRFLSRICESYSEASSNRYRYEFVLSTVGFLFKARWYYTVSTCCLVPICTFRSSAGNHLRRTGYCEKSPGACPGPDWFLESWKFA